MSATNRGGKRQPQDLYETPTWCVTRLLDRVWLPPGHWIEPAAGRGAIMRAVEEHPRYRAFRPFEPRVRWEAVEINDAFEHDLEPYAGTALSIGASFLDEGFPAGCKDVLITNPPFSLALDFVRAALPIAPWVVMLLRLNFIASRARAGVFSREMPDVYVLPNRPSFTGGGSDATEYAWFVWTPDRGRRSGRVEVLAETPVNERTR